MLPASSCLQLTFKFFFPGKWKQIREPWRETQLGECSLLPEHSGHGHFQNSLLPPLLLSQASHPRNVPERPQKNEGVSVVVAARASLSNTQQGKGAETVAESRESGRWAGGNRKCIEFYVHVLAPDVLSFVFPTLCPGGKSSSLADSGAVSQYPFSPLPCPISSVSWSIHQHR